MIKSALRLIFGDYLASRLGPWLSLGSLSPRQARPSTGSCHSFSHSEVFFESLRVCQERDMDAARHAQQLITELSWRDFFRFYAGKHGVSIFQEGGVKGYRRRWMQDERIFKLWAQGRTGSTPLPARNHKKSSFKMPLRSLAFRMPLGWPLAFNRALKSLGGYPLVDACLRELSITGYISRHARAGAKHSVLTCFDPKAVEKWMFQLFQDIYSFESCPLKGLNAASFLAYTMSFDWRP